MSTSTNDEEAKKKAAEEAEAKKKAEEEAAAKAGKSGEGEDDELKLSDKQWAQVFKTKKFSDLKAKADELESVKKTQEAEEEKKLKDSKKFEELAEKKDEKIKTLQNQLLETQLSYKVALSSQKLGVVDIETVVQLIPRSELKVDENSGEITNLEEILNDLLTKKPFLKGTGSSANIGSATNSSGQMSGKQTWKESELRQKMRDHSWYTKNKEEIDNAFAEGRVLKGQ